jgi:CubicO group peptidase (beta-lactamase class C family)
MATLDDTIEEAMKWGRGGIPGLVLIGTDKTGTFVDGVKGPWTVQRIAGKQIYFNIPSYSSISDDAKPTTRDVVLKIAPCTKLITSIATLQCVERGQIDLDDEEA